MVKMTKRELFVKAHKMTREIVKETGVNYRVQFGICLSFLYKNKEEKKVTVEEKLNNLGCKTWEKGEKKRVYINDLGAVAAKLGYKMTNNKIFKRTDIYYDVKADKFCFNCTSSVESSVREVIKLIREAA